MLLSRFDAVATSYSCSTPPCACICVHVLRGLEIQLHRPFSQQAEKHACSIASKVAGVAHEPLGILVDRFHVNSPLGGQLNFDVDLARAVSNPCYTHVLALHWIARLFCNHRILGIGRACGHK